MYHRLANSIKFRSNPIGIISDQQDLDYVHDTAFAPSGEHLAVVARKSNSLLIYKWQRIGDQSVDMVNIQTIQGASNGLEAPAAVAYHPGGNYVAVANRMSHGISIYKRSEDGFLKKPVQILGEMELLDKRLPSPQGLEFSPDGKYLIALHKRFFRSPHQADSALAVFKWSDNRLDENPVHIKGYENSDLHLVSFHPSGKTVAVAYEKEGVDILKWDAENVTLDFEYNIPLIPIGDGAKGIGFAPDGNHVVTSTDLNKVLFFDL